MEITVIALFLIVRFSGRKIYDRTPEGGINLPNLK